MTVDRLWLLEFLMESNAIEGIDDVGPGEMEWATVFLNLEAPGLLALYAYVQTTQPGAELRERAGLNVRVGTHIAPSGGPEIRSRLEILMVSMAERNPYEWHRDYLTLHPFTDGNGRSSRLCWLWMMLCDGWGDVHWAGWRNRSFLLTWYFMSLDAADGR